MKIAYLFLTSNEIYIPFIKFSKFEAELSLHNKTK